MQKVMERKVKVNELAVESVLITPDVAKSWLDKNTNNRRLARTTVEAYASDMAAGRWRLTGDPIRFDVNGTLIDGQHRLAACVKSNKPFASAVIYGLPTEAREVLDIGKKRTVRDVLMMEGTLQCDLNSLAAAARFLARFRDTGGVNGAQSITYSHGAVLDIIDRHPKLAISVVMAHPVRTIMPISALIALHYVAAFCIGKKTKADKMIETLKTGVPAYPDDPIHRFRERVVNPGVHKMDRASLVVNLITAWNHFAANRTLERMMTPKNREAKIDGLKPDMI